MNTNGYVPAHPIPDIKALQAWLDKGQPVYYRDGIMGETAIRMTSLAYLESAIKRGDLRYGLPGPVKPEAEPEQPRRYRSRSRAVEALRWTGKNTKQVFAFACGDEPNDPRVFDHADKLMVSGGSCPATAIDPGGYVVKGEGSELRAVNAKNFARDYEPVEAAPDVKVPAGPSEAQALREMVARRMVEEGHCPPTKDMTHEHCRDKDADGCRSCWRGWMVTRMQVEAAAKAASISQGIQEAKRD